MDYVYAYTWSTSDANAMKAGNLAQRSAGTIDAIPSLRMGWHTQAWSGGGSWTGVDLYKGLARWAKDTLMPSHSPSKLGSKMVMLANWNEFGEGQFLMSTGLHGFGYLDALRDVFTAGGSHTDPVPTETQKARFNHHYLLKDGRYHADMAMPAAPWYRFIDHDEESDPTPADMIILAGTIRQRSGKVSGYIEIVGPGRMVVIRDKDRKVVERR